VDVQQLTILPGRTVWSLSDRTALDGIDPWVDATPWWLVDLPEPSGSEQADGPSTPQDAAVTDRSASRSALVVATVVALLVSAAAGVALLAGARWFVVETPSMGTAAPVGTLVITTPAPAELHRGDVIAFTPPGMTRTYTHRVLSVAADGSLTTKGDINGAPDAWTVPHPAVIGKAAALLPGVGFVVRAIPVLVIGAVLVLLLTVPIRSRSHRAAGRVLGLHLVATGVLLWLHPLVQIVLIASEAAGDAVRASVVSTGLLPVRLVDAAGTVLARLSDGTPQVVLLPATAHAAGRIDAVPDLGWPLQLALVAVAVLPSVAVLVIGLPRDEPGTEAA